MKTKELGKITILKLGEDVNYRTFSCPPSEAGQFTIKEQRNHRNVYVLSREILQRLVTSKRYKNEPRRDRAKKDPPLVKLRVCVHIHKRSAF